MRDIAYLKLLAREYPTIQSASTEIINLTAIQGLPKGTEYFFSDLHGEHEAFIHLLRSSSGIIREKIKETFGYVIPEDEQDELANLIYYPKRTLNQLAQSDSDHNNDDWKRITIYRLVQLCKQVSSKYTRSKVRKKLPPDFAYVIDELLHVDYNADNKKVYYSEIVQTIIDIGSADQFICVLCELIQNLTIDNLHIIGDIFDRGPRADLILNELMNFHDVDIQWGNHDISWMGAATGNLACMCNVLRIAISYNSFDVLEDGYGINLRPLSMFAASAYRDDPCTRFKPHILDQNIYDVVDPGLVAKMHKAITVIQFKVEGQIIKRHPEYGLNHRCLLEHVDFDKGTVEVDGKTYPMLDMKFPTIDPKDPLKLTEQEAELLQTLKMSFRHSGLLHKHIKFLYSHGSMYKCCNNNLLYHGCIPMEKNGDFAAVPVHTDEALRGREAIDAADVKARQGYFSTPGTLEREDGQDFLWYLGSGPNSPLFGKDKMATFERYFVADKATHVENKNPYYDFQNDEQTALRILGEFGLSDSGFIINGHVPVKLGQGESPIRAGGRLLVIDGGLSRAYQPVTGIAGYTLIFTSHELNLVAHQPFESTAAAISAEQDIHSVQSLVKRMPHRLLIDDTDDGEDLRCRIDDLMRLITAYRKGVIKEARS